MSGRDENPMFTERPRMSLAWDVIADGFIAVQA